MACTLYPIIIIKQPWSSSRKKKTHPKIGTRAGGQTLLDFTNFKKLIPTHESAQFADQRNVLADISA